MLSLACLALVLAPFAPTDEGRGKPAPPGKEARIEVLRGRLGFVSGGRSGELVGEAQTAVVTGTSHLEVPAGSRARVVFAGHASLTLWGPAALEWGTEERGGSPTLYWRVQDIAWLDIEVREGLSSLYLPGGWFARVGSGSFHFEGLPSGALELLHRAGSPLVVEWRKDPSSARPPLGVYPGSSLRLEPPASPVDGAASARPWSEESGSWPWRRPADQSGEVESRIAAPRTLAREPEFADPTSVTLLPGPRTPAGGASGARIPQAVVGPVEYTRDYVASQWRGVPRESLIPAGPVAVQRARGVEVRLAAKGRRKVFVAAAAARPVWCFGRTIDHLLHPGAVVLFEEDGAVLMKMGVIEDLPAAQGRPALENLNP